MKLDIKRGIVTGALSLSLLGGSAAGVAAQQGNQGGAAGLVAAVVQANLNDTTIEVIKIEDSLNNLRALNNFLNNSPITVTDVIDVGDINVLNGAQITALNNFLNDSNILLTDVVEISILSGGDLLVQVVEAV
jgi:hypothetical protein